MVEASHFRSVLRQDGLLAIVRGTDPDACVASVRVLAEAGIRLVEVSLTSTDALDIIARLAGSGLPLTLGAGTVLTEQDARRARDAGATFAVTPGAGPGVAEAARLGMPVLAGCLTPSEVIVADQAGHIVKLFPASVFGPAYLRALRDPLPHTDVVPVGGVDLDAARQYLAAGAAAVGVGSPLLGDAPRGGDLAALADRAARFRTAVDEARRP
ncbi:bifunctional 4-hydroxy-2-oxoglutarate aldolase/2-dehydro-3-deoxy-phosphogluconate aldolase [Micromonospora sp. DR5-3]|uniref:bifunctional 4-hydroxy-2-oxoglutarate aldolase/2-dehydro-3-deoxy-phosphogluconate aldolase n=1 Tax=unclassified Micromonospora TaxID=2617518 RepID=UPI0011D77FE8|nr:MULTISPECIES: bifunctional 4-hydroxy-2-oxoglutarate aldolase/2-dehydro-3-deoxy-phosphogluconate aldolase [unclassified Micromonospora]MCW3816404.1 bifunctional 4-hydroxy-2-oxoglutarate aldolase/2-dehydro-3-deoxy-phosphogluconate aldolase [Micromonospora sp. DR5-3]TYC21538.1 bifunctional 4-hydroxy-2-oxoglutarate aldolase/2-dehydro-3-deoxy-phosphogluconate aldolase [Micromonospora sp. MP36]